MIVVAWRLTFLLLLLSVTLFSCPQQSKDDEIHKRKRSLLPIESAVTTGSMRGELRGATPKSIVDYYRAKRAKLDAKQQAMIAPEISAISMPTIRIPYHPYTFEFHSTRYFGGCFTQRAIKGREQTAYNPIPPFLRSFQILVTYCGINWATGSITFDLSGPKSCAYRWNERDSFQIEHYQRNADLPHRRGELRRIHIHSEHRHQAYFAQNIWPVLVQRSNFTGEKYIIHIGGGDAPPSSESFKLFMNSTFVEKWIVEQAIADDLLEDQYRRKIIFMPIGICARENLHYGVELRQILNTTRATKTKDVTNITDHEQDAATTFHRNHLRNHHKHRAPNSNNNSRDSHPWRNSNSTTSLVFAPRDSRRRFLLQEEMVSAGLGSDEDNGGWNQRLDKIFVCFSSSVEKRREILRYLHAHPELQSFCDVCNGTLSRADLWKQYTRYKFVFAPWGSGPDCFRNWEILLMGAIPVIQYFSGAHGYLRAGLPVVLLREKEELTQENVTRWRNEFKGSGPLERLTSDWWTRYLFLS